MHYMARSRKRNDLSLAPLPPEVTAPSCLCTKHSCRTLATGLCECVGSEAYSVSSPKNLVDLTVVLLCPQVANFHF